MIWIVEVVVPSRLFLEKPVFTNINDFATRFFPRFVQTFAELIEHRAPKFWIPTFVLPPLERNPNSPKKIERKVTLRPGPTWQGQEWKQKHTISTETKSSSCSKSCKPKRNLNFGCIHEDRINGADKINEVRRTFWIRCRSDDIHVLPVFKSGVSNGCLRGISVHCMSKTRSEVTFTYRSKRLLPTKCQDTGSSCVLHAHPYKNPVWRLDKEEWITISMECWGRLSLLQFHQTWRFSWSTYAPKRRQSGNRPATTCAIRRWPKIENETQSLSPKPHWQDLQHDQDSWMPLGSHLNLMPTYSSVANSLRTTFSLRRVFSLQLHNFRTRVKSIQSTRILQKPNLSCLSTQRWWKIWNVHSRPNPASLYEPMVRSQCHG